MARGQNRKSEPEAAHEPDDQPQTGDGGAREEAISQAMADFANLHEQLDLGNEAGKVVATATAWVLELFKHRPKPWDQLSQQEQRDLASGIEHNVKELVRLVVEAVAREGRTAVRCLAVGFQDQGEDIKVTLKVKALSAEDTEQAILTLHRSRGKHVLLTMASAEDYAEVPVADQSQPDQTDLGFEAGSDEVDLEEAASDPERLRHGDKAAFAGENGTVRIDLAKGWVQFLPADLADEDANWQDMRAAKPEELAAERERTADFADA
jgi:NADH dehydrogenase/NADH:ubiquinone oxidoreductase subunit G